MQKKHRITRAIKMEKFRLLQEEKAKASQSLLDRVPLIDEEADIALDI